MCGVEPELWHASERSQARPRNIKLAVLVTGTRTVMDRIKCEPKGANGAKGPINAMVGALEQIGWTLEDPVSIKDHRGKSIILTQGSPARLRKLIHKAITDKLEAEFLDKLVKEGAGTDQEFAGARFQGLNVMPIRRTLAAKDLEPGAKLGLRRAFTDGVVTANKLARMG